MGWLDKTFKNIIKSPVGKAALLGGLYMTPWGQAAGTGIMSMLGKANTKMGGSALLKSLWAKPIISKPLTSGATSYGLAKLMRARNPENAALWGAASTLPFLFASANKEALGLAKEGFEGVGGKKASIWDVLLNRDVSMPSKLLEKIKVPTAAQFNMSDINPAYKDFPTRESILNDLNLGRNPTASGFKFSEPNVMDISLRSKPFTRGAGENLNYFMKPPGTEVAKKEGLAALLPHTDFNVLNTMTPILGGVYSAREYDDQKWERIKKQRLEQLAFMYGVDVEDIKGEMDNPYYNIEPPSLDWKYAPTATAAQGGIMNLDNGGDIAGPGTGTSDSINAKVSDGEFIFTNKAVENFGGGDRQVGARRMYAMMNQLDPQSQSPQEGMV